VPEQSLAVPRLPHRAVVWFFAIAYAISWTLTFLTKVSLAFGFLALLGPAVAAFIIAAVYQGRSGVRALVQRLRIWNVGLGRYALAVLIPEAVTLFAALLSVALGEPADIHPVKLNALALITFVMVVGEEIGWRGFALPALLERWRVLPASIVLGVLWGLWHLPTFFVPGMPQSAFPLPAYVLHTTALSVLFAWLYFRTQGSVLYATFLHGCVNTFLVTNAAANPALRHWLETLGWVLVAVAVVVFAGPPFRRRL
jgi:membrane protease YdiL (CAAX protease family)